MNFKQETSQVLVSLQEPPSPLDKGILHRAGILLLAWPPGILLEALYNSKLQFAHL